MNKLLLSILICAIANIGVWLQQQGQFLDYKIMKSQLWVLCWSIPLGSAFWFATKFSYEHFGQFWNIRLIGFGMGTLVFGLMTWLILDETPDLKNTISLILAIGIIMIQVSGEFFK
tara:strand:+ start:133 stop:480 length:348 start_codon:yes stop_codon:yes gene_type:complete